MLIRKDGPTNRSYVRRLELWKGHAEAQVVLWVLQLELLREFGVTVENSRSSLLHYNCICIVSSRSKEY